MTFELPQLDDAQSNALDQIVSWAKDQPESQEFKLGGYAGTGKTTLIKAVVNSLQSSFCTAICAYTGKAVSVLRRKGCHKASTIHSLIYDLEDPTAAEPKYVVRDTIEADLIIVDEASMISQELYTDLIGFGVKILWVGDPGQLEPVGDDINLMKCPDVVLEKIHRQGEGSSILHFAGEVRTSRKGPALYALTSGHKLVDVTIKRWPSGVDLTDCGQVICGFNKTRVSMNKKIRQLLGYTTICPVPGENVICLQNNKKDGVFNGQQLSVVESRLCEWNDNILSLTLVDDLGRRYGPLDCWIPQFGAVATITPADMQKVKREQGIPSGRDGPSINLFDFGYALTAHKSQGSEWEKVTVFEELWEDKWDPTRWRYTAITRASKKLMYYFR